MPFAKLFDTPHGQLLVTTDTEDDKPVIKVRGEDRHGVIVVATCGGYEPKGSDPECEAAWTARDEAFKAIGQIEADGQAANFVQMLDGFMAKSEG